MPVTTVAAVVAVAALDQGFTGSPVRVHPVVLFGRFVSPIDREWSRPTLVGTVVAVALSVLTADVTAAVTWAATLVSPRLDAAVAALVLLSITNLRMLLDVVVAVVSATTGESGLDTTRCELRALTGRGPSSLSAADIRNAAVESAAENLADGLVAPLLAFMLFVAVPLPFTVGAAVWVRGVNALDLMLGYWHKPVGRVPAHLDGMVMWFSMRVSTVLLTVVAGAPATVVRVGELTCRPSPPNSERPTAALTVLLEARLEEPGHYLLDGGPETPDAAMTAQGVRLVSRVGFAAFAVAEAVA